MQESFGGLFMNALRGAIVISLLISVCPRARAYSQFTHEELVDILWEHSIKPSLVRRFPGAGPAELVRAHAYAYGGCLIQDIGYYPFGNRFFSDLAHYVRTGDFVSAMLREAGTIDELAFAIGALTHYVGDSIGHGEGVNPATALTFPDLEKRYGPVVTFEEAPIAHVRTEFGFDVAQTAWQRYAPRACRKRIGFRVARPLLYRAFRETYGISAQGILGFARSALPSYRWSISSLLPAFLHAQVVLLGDDLPSETEDSARNFVLAGVSSSDYSQGKVSHKRPGVGSHLLALFIRLLPELGKLKILATKAPSTETEDLFITSLAHAIAVCQDLVNGLFSDPSVDVQLANLDLDTGDRPVPGRSKRLDETYGKLLLKVSGDRQPVTAGVRSALIAYYSDPAHHARLYGSGAGRQKLAEAVSTLLGLRPMAIFQ